MKESITSIGQLFDELAQDYDEDFTESGIGKLLRRRTQVKMAEIFTPGSQVLEINCGTGEDAAFLARKQVRVTATDGSAGMVKLARNKIIRLGLSENVRLVRSDYEELDSVLESGQMFDGIVSNFGGLNCAEDLDSLAEKLVLRVRPGGHIFLCVMGRLTPWELVILGWRRQFRRIIQRLRGRCEWRNRIIQYYSPGQLLKYFAPYCDTVRVSGLGFLIPPTYAESIVRCFPGMFHWLNEKESRIESVIGIPQLSDHFVVVLVRK